LLAVVKKRMSRGGGVRGRSKGFTLIELVAVILILSVVALTVIERWLSLNADADLAQAKAVGAALRAGFEQVQLSARVQGVSQTGNGVEADIAGIPVVFRSGFPDTTSNSAHVPSGINNRNRRSTRLFYLFLAPPYPDQYAAGSRPTGWLYVNGNNNNGNCSGGGIDWSPSAPSGSRYRCWTYYRNDQPVYRVTYSVNSGQFFYGTYQ